MTRAPPPAIAALLSALLAGAATAASAGERATLPPLFPVTAGDDFPAPEATFGEALELIRQNYYAAGLSEAALYRAAILGMLRHVSPPHDPERAKLWAPEPYGDVVNALKGVRASLGVKSAYSPEDGALTVTEVTAGSPADGTLEVRDRILRVNGQRLAGLAVATIDGLLRGEPGGTVRLTVVRDVEVLEVDLAFAVFETPDLRASVLPGNVGLIGLSRVSENISRKLADALEKLRGRGIERLVLDLRGNSGGVFTEGLRLAEIFVPKGKVLLYTRERGDEIRSFVSSNPAPATFEIAVLVDRGTASSGEILAAALRAHAQALLVGTRTFGKATMERTFRLANDYRTKFIVGALYGPDGKTWHHRGLAPDISITGEGGGAPGAELDRDSQLRAAWNVLRER
jgi:carboxyl-terminal processing protease